MHNLLLELACCQFKGRWLGFQYLAGGAGEAEGRDAARILAEGSKAIDKISAWISRFPEEQTGFAAGWQSYYSFYEKVFSALETQVREKLAQGE